MTVMNRIINSVLRGVVRLTCRINTEELEKIPANGPLILITNHINILEAPILYLFTRPRNTIALAKQELWNHAFTRALMNWWECIPVDRSGMDREALNACFSVLDRKDILCIAPEGTRNRNGQMIQGKAGTGFIAFKKKVPILPVANFGAESYIQNIKRLRRTKITFKVGEPFIIDTDKRRLTGEERQAVTDEMMIRIARLLPESYHGFYADRIDEPFIFTKTIKRDDLS